MVEKLKDTVVCACAAVCVLVAGLVGLGCGRDGTGPERDYLWPEDRGIALTPADEEVWAPLAWSADGGEIFFGGPDGIKAVEILSGSMRVVDDRHSAHEGLTLSADGERLYFTAWDDGYGQNSLYSVSADGTQSELVVNVSGSGDFAVSPDNVHIAYHAHGDSIFLLNVTDHSTVFVSTGKPLTFSSDGAVLLYGCHYWPGYGGAPPCATFTYNLDTQDSEHVLDADYHIEMLRWDRDGIRVLHRWFDELSVWNVTDDVTNDLTFSMRDEENLAWTYAWSFDGSMIAVWTGRCIGWAGDLTECVKSESRLHVVDADGRGDNVVAVVHKSVASTGLAGGNPSYCAEMYCDRIIFAPDGSRIAYITDERIYMKDLP